jgi:alkylation response protein AidB-like acyl-CoA dehydrogenase
MDVLINILSSFQKGWKKSDYLSDFVDILNEMIIPSYPSLHAKIENNRALLPKRWHEIMSALKDFHIFKLFIPPEYGGHNASEQEIYFLMELFGYSSPGIGVILVSHGRAVDVVLQGTSEQKERYLPEMAMGALGAIAMTEERAGCDVSAISLMAKRRNHNYRLNGQKTYISNSGLAEIYTVLANTKGLKGSRSLSVFIAGKDTPGLSIKKLPEKDGLKVLPVGRLDFNDAPVPVENLVGSEGMGMGLALDVIDRGRIHIAGICCGLAYRIFREIYHYARKRKQFDNPLTSSQDITFQLSDMHTKMNAARGLCLHALRQLGTPHYRISSSQAKLYASRMVMDVAVKAQILMGGRGYFKNELINQLSADARGMEYLEGTSNIQKMIIGNELYTMYRQDALNQQE